MDINTVELSEAQRFKAVRKELGFTQPEFGNRLHSVSKTFICLLESGKRTIPSYIKEILYTEYNISPAYLENGILPIFVPTNNEKEIISSVECLLRRDDTDSKKQLLLRILQMQGKECDALIMLLGKLIPS